MLAGDPSLRFVRLFSIPMSDSADIRMGTGPIMIRTGPSVPSVICALAKMEARMRQKACLSSLVKC